MFRIRDATSADLDGLQRLAAIFNTVNLPDDVDVLKDLLKESARAFSGREKDPLQREYLFVMDDLTDPSAPKIIGTSQIIAQHGTKDAPHIYLDVLDEERYSRTIDRHFKHKVLRIGFDYDGPTEIGGLVLDPNYRGAPGKLGRQLSFVRFLFIAMHRAGFRNRILAELLPPLRDDGTSVLWEALGRKFTGMDYLEADKISKHNKEFIRALFPSSVIHASLLADEAQEVIGKVGENTQGVRRMLESLGFEPVDRIDPFDGGPHFEAETDSLWPVSKSRPGELVVKEGRRIREAPGESAEGLIAFSPKRRSKKQSHFQAVWSDFREGESATIEVPEETREALGAKEGDSVWALAFARHSRM